MEEESLEVCSDFKQGSEPVVCDSVFSPALVTTERLKPMSFLAYFAARVRRQGKESVCRRGGNIPGWFIIRERKLLFS